MSLNESLSKQFAPLNKYAFNLENNENDQRNESERAGCMGKFRYFQKLKEATLSINLLQHRHD